MLSPNIYRTTAEALESFDYFSKIGKLVGQVRSDLLVCIFVLIRCLKFGLAFFLLFLYCFSLVKNIWSGRYLLFKANLNG